MVSINEKKYDYENETTIESGSRVWNIRENDDIIVIEVANKEKKVLIERKQTTLKDEYVLKERQGEMTMFICDISNSKFNSERMRLEDFAQKYFEGDMQVSTKVWNALKKMILNAPQENAKRNEDGTQTIYNNISFIREDVKEEIYFGINFDKEALKNALKAHYQPSLILEKDKYLFKMRPMSQSPYTYEYYRYYDVVLSKFEIIDKEIIEKLFKELEAQFKEDKTKVEKKISLKYGLKLYDKYKKEGEEYNQEVESVIEEYKKETNGFKDVVITCEMTEKKEQRLKALKERTNRLSAYGQKFASYVITEYSDFWKLHSLYEWAREIRASQKRGSKYLKIRNMPLVFGLTKDQTLSNYDTIVFNGDKNNVEERRMWVETIKTFVETHRKSNFLLTYEDEGGYTLTKEKRLFISREGVLCEYKRGSASRGYPLDKLENLIRMDCKKQTQTDENEQYDKKMEKIIGYLRKSGLWESILKEAIILKEIGNENIKKIQANESDENITKKMIEEILKTSQEPYIINEMSKSKEDLIKEAQYAMQETYLIHPTIKTIRFSSNIEIDERAREEIEKAMKEKRDYQKNGVYGYDCSFRYSAKDAKAWYSQEYKGTGNGHYYLALDARHAIFYEDD